MAEPATNMIQALADDLLARAMLVSDANGGLTVYDISDMKFERRKIPKLPGIFIIYRSGSTTTKRMMRYQFDLYILAGMDRINRVNQHAIQYGSALLVDLRRSIVSAECDTTPAGRVWEFAEEAPAEIDENIVVYRQRWSVLAVQFC